MLAGLTCDLCGVARRMMDDPPLDIPYRPRLTRIPAFWLSMMWGVAALGGVALWLSPVARGTLGNVFLIGEIVASGSAAVSSLFTALWHRLFNELELVVPAHVKTGEPLVPVVRLVPYETLNNVTVKVKLVDRYFQKSQDGVERAQRELASITPLRRARLRGRRLTSLSADFVAPFPDTPHESIQADIMADVLGLLSFAVPALAWQARNLREHGGYYVEAKVRVGFLSRKYHKRVITYYVGGSFHVG